MPRRNSLATVLLLDRELGFMLALSQELSRRRIAVFPAANPKQARELLAHFQLSPDALVMECGQPGACALAKDLAEEHAALQIIGIVSERHACEACRGRMAAQFRDPQDREPPRVPHCADVIEALVKEQRRHAHRAGSLH